MILQSKPYIISADEFREHADLYLLSHAHSDHTGGLGKTWDKGELICSPVTAKLIAHKYGCTVSRLIKLAAGKKIDRSGVTISAYDANHCPGALMFVLTSGKRKVIYTGDFRFCASMRALKKTLSKPDVLYLDTTYEKDKRDFPSQEEAIAEVLAIIKQHEKKRILIGVYTIGKNKIIDGIYSELGMKVYVPEKNAKTYIIAGQGKMITTVKQSTNIHIYTRHYIDNYFQITERDIVIMPTAMDGALWGGRPRKGYRYVPYTEHSSSSELADFISMIQPKKIVRIS